MEQKLTQKELKELLIKSFEPMEDYVGKVTFKTDIDENGKPVFQGADVTFLEGPKISAGTMHMHESQIALILNDYFKKDGLTAADEYGIVHMNFEMGTRMVGSDPNNRVPVPVFKGITVNLQEYTEDMKAADEMDEYDMEEEPMASLADMRRAEQVEAFKTMDGQEILEMANAHFNSHPTMPGEKSLKTAVLDQLANDGDMYDDVREDIIQRYAKTRIRETKMNTKDFAIILEIEAKEMAKVGTVSVKRADVELHKTDDAVIVQAKDVIGKYNTIGKLPDKFLTNNPMNVENCKAELQVTDYSNGKMKNLAMRVVVDTDLMSGDVVELDNEMLADLDQDAKIGLEQ